MRRRQYPQRVIRNGTGASRGVMKYTGANNDRDPILLNGGGSTPTVVRHAELP